jgi:hypothetical protein
VGIHAGPRNEGGHLNAQPIRVACWKGMLVPAEQLPEPPPPCGG